ncbi:hypothetical protein F4553_001931 [Allocatelliglobosispora scoriae]|uniref:DUF4194 domain-containing protein n=1 Tax=Allocatelliglobosispora scoriae TaxID=643052 RepID=A0A841BP84_9ACTN|nr:DUF4194 domain-containing protein [Allocatelliglobosispora scoriae]MBB5868552.1 hypothetical protein [Allocatelliglobosispora scoriae]
MSARPHETAPDLSVAVTQLMKGVVYRDTHEVAWRHLLALQPQVRDHVAVVGLQVVVDDAEGYAFLRSRPDSGDGDEPAIPRLIARRQLSLHLSILLALLRKRLAEFDARAADTRLVLTRAQIIDTVTVFMSNTKSDARVVDQIDANIAKAVDLGFLRRMGDAEGSVEVRRILKAFVDAQWLSDFDARLAAYAQEFADPDGGGGNE